MPQSIIIDISKISLYPKNGFNFFGIQCLHESSSNPKTIQVLISDNTSGCFFVHLGTFNPLMKSGIQIFKIKYYSEYISSLKKKIKLIKIIIQETYGNNQTYINNIMFYEKISKSNKNNRNEMNEIPKIKKFVSNKKILSGKARNHKSIINKKNLKIQVDNIKNISNRKIPSINKKKMCKISERTDKEKKALSNEHNRNKKYSDKLTQYSDNSLNDKFFINGVFNDTSKKNIIVKKRLEISPASNLDKQIFYKNKNKLLIHNNTLPNKINNNFNRNYYNSDFSLKIKRKFLCTDGSDENDYDIHKNLLNNKLNVIIHDSNSNNENCSPNYKIISYKIQKAKQLNEKKKNKNFRINRLKKHKTNIYNCFKYDKYDEEFKNITKKNIETKIPNENAVNFSDFMTIGQYIDQKIEKVSSEIEKRIISRIANDSLKKKNEAIKSRDNWKFYDTIEKLHFHSRIIKKKKFDKQKNISNNRNK